MAKRLAREHGGQAEAKQAARRRKNVITAAIIAAAVGAVAGVGYLAMSASGPQRGPDGLLARGVEAPAFSLSRLGGSGTVSPGDFKGRVVVVNFWHSQ